MAADLSGKIKDAVKNTPMHGRQPCGGEGKRALTQQLRNVCTNLIRLLRVVMATNILCVVVSFYERLNFIDRNFAVNVSARRLEKIF